MKKAMKIFVPILLTLAVLFSIGWYLMEYDRTFTRDLLLQQARNFEDSGHHSVAAWMYHLAYRHAGNDEQVAIELAQQFKALENYTKAEYTLSNAIADSGGSVELYLALCKTYVEQDKLLDAVTMLDSIADASIKARLNAMRPAAPTANIAPGFYNQYITVTLSAESGKLYFTANDQYPSTAHAPQGNELTLPGGETTIYALAVADNGLVSPLSVFGYTIGGVVEPVTFADDGFAQFIRQVLGVSDDHVVYTNELWQITELEIPSDISNCEDLRWLPFLKSLTLNGGYHENLNSISSLSGLETLTISDTVLSATDIAAIGTLTKLQNLSLESCGLSTIAGLEGAKNLVNLNLSNNTIRDIGPLSAMPLLQTLNLSHNALTATDALAGLTNLRELDLSYNSLFSAAPLATCYNLTHLDLSNNTLAQLDGIDKLSALTQLSAASNRLTEVNALASCSLLETLDISSNTILDIQPLAALTNLADLNFSYNEVEQLPAFPADCALVNVDGSHNLIVSLEPLAGLRNLNNVYMDYNSEISSVSPLAKCPKLVQVNIFGTAVTDVSELTAMSVVVNYDPT